MKDLPGIVLAFALLGAIGILFGINLGIWWAANQLGMWQYAGLATGGYVFYLFAKEIIKEVRK